MTENAENKYALRPASVKDAGFYFASSPEEDEQRGCIGHVRMDFGRSGKEFWHTWWPRGAEKLNSPEFKKELTDVVNDLRKNVLSSFSEMQRFCREHGGEIPGGWEQNYGYEIQTERYRYCLRCNPLHGDYNAYLTCYDLQAQQLVGRLTFANGEVMEYTDKDAFLAAFKEELEFRPTTGMEYKILTDDPALRKAVDDAIYDLYGEENPSNEEDYEQESSMQMGGMM